MSLFLAYVCLINRQGMMDVFYRVLHTALEYSSAMLFSQNTNGCIKEGYRRNKLSIVEGTEKTKSVTTSAVKMRGE